MIEITAAAKARLGELLDKNPGRYLRIVVEGDGCAGPYLGLSLDTPGENELTTRVDEIVILISDLVKRYAEVTTIRIDVNHLANVSSRDSQIPEP